MGEIWGAAIAAGVSLASGAMASRSAKKQSKFEAAQSKEMVPLQGLEERRNIAYDYEYQDYMAQREKQRKAGAFAGLAKRMGGSGTAANVQAVRPTDPNPSGGVAPDRPSAGPVAPLPDTALQAY